MRQHPQRLMSRPRRQTGAVTRAAGQSMVEFTLILPILLLLLLTVADFGRFFAAGITVESIARTAAEYAAREYLRETVAVGGAPLDAAAYARVHAYAWQTVCDEAAGLPGVATGDPDDPCSGIPTVVCIHDLSDPGCGNSYNAAGGIPPECVSLGLADVPTSANEGGSETSRYVEVRVCYRFSTLLPVDDIPSIGGPLSPLAGAFYIERERAFTVVDYCCASRGRPIALGPTADTPSSSSPLSSRSQPSWSSAASASECGSSTSSRRPTSHARPPGTRRSTAPRPRARPPRGAIPRRHRRRIGRSRCIATVQPIRETPIPGRA